MNGHDGEVQNAAAAAGAPLAVDPWAAAAAASRRGNPDGSDATTASLGKRASADGDAPGSERKQSRPSEPTTAARIAALLDSQWDQILSCVANLESKVDANHAAFRQHVAHNDTKLDQLKSQQGEVGTKVQVIEGKLKQLALENTQLRSTIALADVPPASRPSVQGPRDPNRVEYDIVHLRARAPVGLEQVQELANQLLKGAGLDGSAGKLTGPPVGRAFRLQLGGDGQTAARRAKKLVESRRVDGKWEESWITRPGEQGHEKVFISLDRSQNEIKRDNNYKSLKRAIADVVPRADPFKNDRDGIILCWQPVVRLGEDRTSLEWLPAAAEQNLDKAAIE